MLPASYSFALVLQLDIAIGLPDTVHSVSVLSLGSADETGSFVGTHNCSQSYVLLMQGLEAAVGAASLTTDKLEHLAEMAVGVAAFAVLQTAETAKQAGKVGLGATVMGAEKAEQVSMPQCSRLKQHMGGAAFGWEQGVASSKLHDAAVHGLTSPRVSVCRQAQLQLRLSGMPLRRHRSWRSLARRRWQMWPASFETKWSR